MDVGGFFLFFCFFWKMIDIFHIHGPFLFNIFGQRFFGPQKNESRWSPGGSGRGSWNTSLPTTTKCQEYPAGQQLAALRNSWGVFIYVRFLDVFGFLDVVGFSLIPCFLLFFVAFLGLFLCWFFFNAVCCCKSGLRPRCRKLAWCGGKEKRNDRPL